MLPWASVTPGGAAELTPGPGKSRAAGPLHRSLFMDFFRALQPPNSLDSPSRQGKKFSGQTSRASPLTLPPFPQVRVAGRAPLRSRQQCALVSWGGATRCCSPLLLSAPSDRTSRRAIMLWSRRSRTWSLRSDAI